MKNWGWDDSWILFSWVCLLPLIMDLLTILQLGGGIVLAALNCYLTTLGAGMHLITIKKENAAGLMTYGLVCRILYQFVILTTKYGMCAFYLRIFTDRKSRYFIWGTVAYNTIYTIPLVFTLIFRCNPIQGIPPLLFEFLSDPSNTTSKLVPYPRKMSRRRPTPLRLHNSQHHRRRSPNWFCNPQDPYASPTLPNPPL